MKKIFLTIAGITFFGFCFSQTWFQVQVPTTNKLNDIKFASSTVGYISGDDKTLLKTTDGGETWSVITPSGINIGFTYNIGDLDFVSEMIGFCNISNAGQTYRTVDGGVNWTLIDDSELGNFCYRNAIYALSEDNYFLGGAGCFQSAMFKEYDNGVWTEKQDDLETFNSSEFVRQIDFFGQLGLAATNSNYMLRSTDGGQNWDTIPTPLEIDGVLTSVVILDAMLSYAGYDESGSGFGILKSTDGGLTWEEDMGSATFFYPSFLSVATSTNGDIYSGAYSSGSMVNLMFENTGGINWSYEEVDQKIFSIDSYSNDIVFAVGDSGYVITNTNFGSLRLDNNDELNINIYPNPTLDFVHISAIQPLLKEPLIFNNLGQKISVPLKKDQNGYLMNLQSIPAGIYNVVLDQDGFQKITRIIKQ